MSRRWSQGYTDSKGTIVEKPGVGILFASGTTVPTDATTGFAPGCIFIDTDAAANSTVYINEGTATSCAFKVLPATVLATLGSLTATAAEINQWCDESVKTETVTTTNVIAATESGKTFFLSAAGGFVSTLPAPAAGLFFRFIVITAPASGSYTIVTTSSANIISGQVYTVDVNSATDPDFNTTADQDTITLVQSKAVIGDSVDVWSDGTSWYARCFCSVFDAITITQAS